MDPIGCEQVCRLCADHGTNYTSIFDANSDSIDEKINQCLPITVSENDKLPSHICPECLSALSISDKLRKKSLESDKLLREQLNLSEIKIKNEKYHNNDNNEPMFCGICEITFDNVAEFDEHMEESHLSKWICNLCDENFKTSDDLLQHKYANHYDNMENSDEVGDNIDKLASEDDASIEDDKSIDIKNEEPLTTSDNSFSAKSSSQTTVICDICNVSCDNETEMPYHRKFHAPRAMTCWTCDTKSPSAYDLFLHKQDVHGHFKGTRMKFCCENCERFSSCFKVFRRHINCQNAKLKCQYCEREFSKNIEFVRHQKKNHREEMMKDRNCKKWQCSICDKLFVNRSYYTFHIRMHKIREEKKYKCDLCDKFFASSAHLGAHREGVHEKQPKYQCETCFKTFCTRRNLVTHQKRHADQTCRQCSKEFGDSRSFTAHLKKVHDITLPVDGKFACKQCPKKFPKLRLLEDHQNIHSRKEPYRCDTCDKRFRTYAAKWSHEQSHKRQAYVCDYCQTGFKSKQNLARHMQGHLPPEFWRYECKVCRAKFKRTSHLKDHMRSHSKDHVHKCDICGARYLHKQHMLRHRKRHAESA